MKKRDFLILAFLALASNCTRYQIPGVIKDIMKKENIVLVPATTEDIKKALFKGEQTSPQEIKNENETQKIALPPLTNNEGYSDSGGSTSDFDATME